MVTEKEIVEGNKLLAEFWKNTETKHPYFGWFLTNYPKDSELLFNSDWNWLMPVVEKIESIEDEKTGNAFQVVIYEEEVNIWDKRITPWKEVVNISADGNSKLQNTWKACIEFAKYYNSNKQE